MLGRKGRVINVMSGPCFIFFKMRLKYSEKHKIVPSVLGYSVNKLKLNQNPITLNV